MQAPVALTFCAVAFWKKAWPSAPIPQTRTVRSRVERGAGAEADMSTASFLRIPYTIPVDLYFIILVGAVCEGYHSPSSFRRYEVTTNAEVPGAFSAVSSLGMRSA